MSDKFIEDKKWNEALRRAKIIAALPDRLGSDDTQKAMQVLGVSRSTLFRWVKLFRKNGRTCSMLPQPRGPKSAMQPLEFAVEAIVERHFNIFYATRRKPTRTRFWRETAADCWAAKLQPPSIRRLGRWLKMRDQADLMRKRDGKGKSEPVFLATPGKLKAANPLDIMQIDHTKADVTVVDPGN